MSILPELLAQIVAISFCFHVKKKKKDTSVEWISSKKKPKSTTTKYRILSKILLLSDTHSYIDDTILKYVALADEVWHAGDIEMAVTDALKK
jgi:hypothetical protein